MCDRDPVGVRALFASIAGRYDLANRLLSLGRDVEWRRRVAGRVRAVGASVVVDLATGSGDLARAIARASPGARVLAMDFCLPLLRLAAEKGVGNLAVADALRLPLADGVADAVTVAFGLRNMESWEGAIAEAARVLRAGGRLWVLDFSMPGRALRPLYRVYLHRVLPVVAGWVTGRRGAYDYLARSIELFPRGEAMLRMLLENGFVGATETRWSLGVVTLYEALRGEGKGAEDPPARSG